jgi:hypothetical protein
MYVNAKMIPFETAPGIRGGDIGERSRGGEFTYKIFDTYIVRIFVNAVMNPYPAQQLKIRTKKDLVETEFMSSLTK